ncbi:uncharacterized protein Fot_41663 [Forsythia ovata]|uniref:Uncharacterized protein n=1 Tax=Forsythia ovata TaxID=205694 RepID=A0ABD1RJM5_9LAMI
MATFIGFSLTVPAAGSAGHPASCNASIKTVRILIVFEVVSFSFFLFSSLIAQSIKLTINLLNSLDPTDPHKADIDSSALKYGLCGSAFGSIMGCVFLMLSIVNFIQVKLGVFSCGHEPVYGVVTLVICVGSALLLTINLLNNLDATDPYKADIDSSALKYGLFGLAFGSVMGCVFFMLSIVNLFRLNWVYFLVDMNRYTAS